MSALAWWVRRRAAGVGSCCFAAFAEELKHGGAGVDCVGVEMWVVCEELGEEAAVSVAQDQGAAAVEELWEIVGAAIFERSCRE